MKVRIEIDCTPEEFRDLFVPSDKQAEFAAKAYQAMIEAGQKAMTEAMLRNLDAFRPGGKP